MFGDLHWPLNASHGFVSIYFTSFLHISILLCPQLPVWVQQSHRHLPNRAAFELFSLLFVYVCAAKICHISKHGQSIDVSCAKYRSVFAIACLHLLFLSYTLLILFIVHLCIGLILTRILLSLKPKCLTHRLNVVLSIKRNGWSVDFRRFPRGEVIHFQLFARSCTYHGWCTSISSCVESNAKLEWSFGVRSGHESVC